jgi:hypothetical protein
LAVLEGKKERKEERKKRIGKRERSEGMIFSLNK